VKSFTHTRALGNKFWNQFSEGRKHIKIKENMKINAVDQSGSNGMVGTIFLFQKGFGHENKRKCTRETDIRVGRTG
jgi:hypothetical protein